MINLINTYITQKNLGFEGEMQLQYFYASFALVCLCFFLSLERKIKRRKEWEKWFHW